MMDRDESPLGLGAQEVWLHEAIGLAERGEGADFGKEGRGGGGVAAAPMPAVAQPLIQYRR